MKAEENMNKFGKFGNDIICKLEIDNNINIGFYTKKIYEMVLFY